METAKVTSRLEINFNRLLDVTQEMANGAETKEWLFPKCIAWLQLKLPEMQKSPNAPAEEKLKHYQRRVDFLVSVLAADECEKVTELSFKAQLIPHGAATTNEETLIHEIHQKTKAHVDNKLRHELFGLANENVRKRKTATDSALAENFQDDMALDEERRDRIIEDMIIMTKEWKEQSKVTNKVLKKDIETLENSSKVTDVNTEQLKTEADRLTEFNKHTCNCWIWLMIMFICCTFISMVFFIRLFPKKL